MTLTLSKKDLLQLRRCRPIDTMIFFFHVSNFHEHFPLSFSARNSFLRKEEFRKNVVRHHFPPRKTPATADAHERRDRGSSTGMFFDGDFGLLKVLQLMWSTSRDRLYCLCSADVIFGRADVRVPWAAWQMATRGSRRDSGHATFSRYVFPIRFPDTRRCNF